MGKKRRWERLTWGAVVLCLLALVPNWRIALLGELPLPEGYLALIAPEIKSKLLSTPWNALWWDSIGQFWAWRTEAMRQFSLGRIPLWTNRVGCGFPFLANPQTQCLYPPTLIGTWASNWLGGSLDLTFSVPRPASPVPVRSARLMAWLAFFHTLLALIGSYLLIRSYGISRLSSFVGAAAYGLGSFQISWALLPTLPATAAWLPLTIWFLRNLLAAVSDAKAKTAVGFGIGFSISLAMLLLAGHGQIAIYSLLALFLFALLELIPIYRKIKFFALLAIALPLVLSFLLASAQLLPTMELAPLTHRHGAPTWEGYKLFAQRGLTISDWATAALPFLFGNPIDGSYFGKESFADYCTYAGFGILVLAILGFLWLCGSLVFQVLRKRLHTYTPAHLHSCTPTHLHACTLTRLNAQTLAPLHALLLFLLGALLASGSTLNLPLYFLLPGFSQLGTPSRAVFLCQLALGLMAAWVLETGRGARDEGRDRWWAISAIAVASTTLVLAVGYVGWWLSINLPNFSWGEWVSFLTEQNIGVVVGFLAVVVFALRHCPLLISQSPTLRYALALLLVGELSWFAAQQIPTARPSKVQQALQIAEENLSKLVKPIPNPKSSVPVRLLPIGGDWSLVRYPQTLLPPNSILLLPRSQTADARNYDSLLLRHHKAVMALFSKGNPCPLENGNLILMPARQVSLQDAKRLAQIVGADAVIEAFGESIQIAQNASHQLQSRKFVKMPRAFIPLKVRYAKTVNEAVKGLQDCPENTALIVASPRKHHADFGDFASVISDKDSIVRIRLGSPKIDHLVRSVWLVLSDTNYPGWKVFMRKGFSFWRQLPIEIANGAFRACHVPDVFGEVVWIYFPASFAVGLFLSCIGVFCVVAIAIAILPNLRTLLIASHPLGKSR